METDDARWMFRLSRQLVDREGGSVSREDVGVVDLRIDIAKNFLFYRELFRCGLDHDLHFAHRPGIG